MALAAPIAKGGTCLVMPDGFFCLAKPSETTAWKAHFNPGQKSICVFL